MVDDDHIARSHEGAKTGATLCLAPDLRGDLLPGIDRIRESGVESLETPGSVFTKGTQQCAAYHSITGEAMKNRSIESRFGSDCGICVEWVVVTA